MDGLTAAYLGFLIAYSGDWERGCALGALDIAHKINMPGFWRTQLALATAYVQLGEREAARNAVRELLVLRPDFAVVAREELGKWWDPELIERLIDGLRKAGLEIAPDLRN
jgi:hypothetical protein